MASVVFSRFLDYFGSSTSSVNSSQVLFINANGVPEISTYTTEREFISISDRKCQQVCLTAIETVRELIMKNAQLKAVNLAGFTFPPANNLLKPIIEAISAHPSIMLLCFSSNLLSKKQHKQICSLANINEKKGLRILDATGKKFGSAYVNWDNYYQHMEKKVYKDPSLYLGGMAPTTAKAVELFQKEYQRLPESTFDYGAGIGRDSINLLNIGCKNILALDSDTKAIHTLKSKVGEEFKNCIECVNQPFIKYEVVRQVQLLVVSYTLPYRRKEDFKACWDKCMSLLEIGGFICGEFFGPKELDNEDKESITYHTEEELLELLKSSNLTLKHLDTQEPEILGASSDCSSTSIDQKSQKFWGDIYHIVAVKNKDAKTK